MKTYFENIDAMKIDMEESGYEDDFDRLVYDSEDVDRLIDEYDKYIKHLKEEIDKK